MAKNKKKNKPLDIKSLRETASDHHDWSSLEHLVQELRVVIDQAQKLQTKLEALSKANPPRTMREIAEAEKKKAAEQE